MSLQQDDFKEIDDFYAWIRDYWADLSRSETGEITNVLNFGYWQSEDDDLFNAQMAFFKTVTEMLSPESGAEGAEIGCGIGGFASRLLQQYDVHLTCFDLLDSHLAMSRQFAEKYGVADRLKTIQGNSMDMADFADNQLDFVYCIESSFHYDEKQKFVDAVYRVMKPGGIFVYADISCEDNSKISFKSGNHFSSKGELDQYVEQAGFRINQHMDIGRQVYKPLRQFVKAFNSKQGENVAPGEKKKRSRVGRYWELVLNNYAQLNDKDMMGYQIYALAKPE